MNTRDKGNLGEDIAVSFLLKRGFAIIGRNYQKKWGEIDIIGRKGGLETDTVHFFEVKSVMDTYIRPSSVEYRPEENVHRLKARRIRRTIQTYLAETGADDRAGVLSSDIEFQFHIVCVFMNMKHRRARVKFIENVIL